MSDSAASRTLPRLPQYRCHKIVEAAKIVDIRMGGLVLDLMRPLDLGPGSSSRWPIEVSVEWAQKHQPQVGGYYVVYEDDYRSYSPAKAFEAGYTRLGEGGERVVDSIPNVGSINRSTERLDAGQVARLREQTPAERYDWKPYPSAAGRPPTKDEQARIDALNKPLLDPTERTWLDGMALGVPTEEDDWLTAVEKRHKAATGTLAHAFGDTLVVSSFKDIPQLVAEIRKLRGYAFPETEPAPGPRPLAADHPQRTVFYANGRRVKLRKIIGAGCVNDDQRVGAPGPIRLYFEGGTSEVVQGVMAEFAAINESYWVESSSGRCYVLAAQVKWDLFDACEPQSQRPVIDGDIGAAVSRDLTNLKKMLNGVEEFVDAMRKGLL